MNPRVRCEYQGALGDSLACEYRYSPQRIIIRSVDNHDQAEISGTEMPSEAPGYSPTRIAMRPVATSVTGYFAEHDICELRARARNTALGRGLARGMCRTRWGKPREGLSKRKTGAYKTGGPGPHCRAVRSTTASRALSTSTAAANHDVVLVTSQPKNSSPGSPWQKSRPSPPLSESRLSRSLVSNLSRPLLPSSLSLSLE
jgi:hypothetical protein